MIKTFLRFGLLTTASLTASAQLVFVGVIGGGSLLEPTLRNDESRRYIVGPSVEIRLPAGFALEADALYQRIGSTSTLNYFALVTGTNQSGTVATTGFATSLIDRLRGNSWEFPLLGKYYLGRHFGAQPFVASGFSLRTIGIEAQGNNFFDVPPVPPNVVQTGPFKSNYRTDLGVGAVVAGGLRYKVGRFSLRPEVRYTRWGSNDAITRKNAVSALLGLSF